MQFASRLAGTASVALVFGSVALSPVHAQNLVTNGGFETGDFTGFVQSGNTINTFVDTFNPRTGAYAAALGPDTTDGFLTQTLTTTPGSQYSIQFFLANEDQGPNDFAVFFGATQLFSGTNLPQSGYTPFSFNALAATNSTDLTFRFRNDLSFFDLDDISVTPVAAAAVPEPGPIVAGGMLFGGLGIGMIRGRKRRQRA